MLLDEIYEMLEDGNPDPTVPEEMRLLINHAVAGAAWLREFSPIYRELFETNPEDRPGPDELFLLAGTFGAILQSLLHRRELLRRVPGDGWWRPTQLLVALEQAMCSVLLLGGDDADMAILPETYDSALDDPFIARFVDRGEESG